MRRRLRFLRFILVTLMTKASQLQYSMHRIEITGRELDSFYIPVKFGESNQYQRVT